MATRSSRGPSPTGPNLTQMAHAWTSVLLTGISVS